MSVSGDLTTAQREQRRAAIRKRWAGHAPTTVRLDGLPAEQRAFLAELIDTARRNAQRAEAGAEGQ